MENFILKIYNHHKYFTASMDKCEAPEGKIIEEYFVVELPTDRMCTGNY